MKPPEEFIKYLQAHPAVWEALQKEWEPAPADWFLHLETGHVGLLAVEESDEIVYVDKEAWYWLPDLGQLRSLLLEAESGTIQTTDFGDRVVMHCKKDFATADEPEIACIALWAKVKGVEEFDWRQDVQRELMDA